MTTGLGAIEHIVVLMLENRSFDHMLGYLYHDTGNTSPAGDAFEGLTGTESCPDNNGTAVPVFPITPETANAYFMPGADPGEGYVATNLQLFGTASPANGTAPTMSGFVTDFANALVAHGGPGWYVVPGTTADMIMGCYTPAALPVLSALARGYAVCDHWYGSAPTETMPNRAFANAGTSQGHLDDVTKSFTVPSIFGLCGQHDVSWKIYGYNREPLTRLNFPDTANAPDSNIGLFTDFQNDCAAGTLPAYSFLEPSWNSTGNSQHPNYNVAAGEQLILDTYRAVAGGPGWPGTLLIVTYDEHGGCYDHVPPPTGATPPDDTVGEYGFDFTRFGPRVPTVLVSPLIAPGTVFRVPDSATPLDHTSILATVEHRWSLPALTRRDAAAEDVGAVLTLDSPRTDDPLAGVSAPQPPATPGALAAQPAHLDQIRDELENRPLPTPPTRSTVTPQETGGALRVPPRPTR
ncbi:phosphoesterase, partial [Mycobacterium eburneum]